MAFAKEKLVAQIGESISSSEFLYLQSLKLRIGKCAALKLFRLVDVNGVPNCGHYAKRATFEDHWARAESTSACPFCSNSISDRFKVKLKERWTRTRESQGSQSFYVDESTVEDVRQDVLEMTDFCKRDDVDLSDYAFDKFDKMAEAESFTGVSRFELAIARDDELDQVRGFALYETSNFSSILSHTKLDIRAFLISFQWIPRDLVERETWYEWVMDTMVQVPDFEEFESEEFRMDLEDRLFAFSNANSIEIDFLGGEYMNFGRWLYAYEGKDALRKLKRKEVYAEVVLICTDELWAGYGIGKGLMRFVQDALLRFTKKVARNRPEEAPPMAFIELKSANDARAVMYEGWGFQQGINWWMFSSDVTVEKLSGISEEEYQKNAAAFQERLKKRRR